MDDKQPLALRLAEQLETEWPEDCDTDSIAAELRRLHNVNAQLLEALEFVMTATGEQLTTAFEQAQDVIAAAKSNT